VTTRARKACSHPDCPGYQPCPTHAPKPWSGSRRREHTVSGWEQQRRARRILYRDNTVCHWCQRPGATIVDHVISLSEDGPDTDDNLAPIHRDCHDVKTAQEIKRAKERAA
jgi:5-methylcytosine-specific restriction endonuclease McrA